MKHFSRFNNMHLIAFTITLATGLVFFLNGAQNNLSAAVVTTGLDTGRADLIAALLITSACALVGTLLSQSKAGAIAGASIVFGSSYLINFIHTLLLPLYDPLGDLEQLNHTLLLYRLLVIVALALISTFIGAAVGSTLAQLVLGPPTRLLKLLWQQVDKKPPALRISRLIEEWLTALSIVALLALAMGSGDIFLYAPDVSLHTTLVKIPSNATNPSTIQTDYVAGSGVNQTRKFILYLPPSYNLPQARTKHYPVLYLLHGSPGAAHDWIVAGQANISADLLIAAGRIPELIMVMPDGNGRPGMTSEWADSFDQAQRIETYISKELVSYVDQHYRTVPDAQHRAIGGLSMGGFGAMNIAIHHPDVFGTVMSFGGYYRAEGSIWGHNVAYQQANSPIITIGPNPLAHKLHIYLGSANKDQPYYNDARQFAQQLDKLHIPYHSDVLSGQHSWIIWQTQLYHALIWLRWSA